MKCSQIRRIFHLRAIFFIEKKGKEILQLRDSRRYLIRMFNPCKSLVFIR